MKIRALLIISLVLVSCKKEISHGNWDQSLSCSEVFDMTVDDPFGNIFYTEDSIQYKYPTFNPNNPNELIYQYIDYTNFSYQIKKYNIQTGMNQVLVDGPILINQPTWSESGKIVYEVYGNQLYLTDQFGSEPVHIGPNGLNQKPSWLGDEDKVIFYHTNIANGEHYLLSLSANNLEIDTLMYPSAGADYFVISEEKRLLSSSGTNFFSKDLMNVSFFTDTDLNQLPLQIDGIAKGLCWSKDGTKFYVSKFSYGSNTPAGLYEVDYPSGTYNRIIRYCDSKAYTTIAPSPDGNYLALQRLDRYQVFNGTGGFTGEIVENSSIYLYNVSTGVEIRLDLD